MPQMLKPQGKVVLPQNTLPQLKGAAPKSSLAFLGSSSILSRTEAVEGHASPWMHSSGRIRLAQRRISTPHLLHR